MQALNHTKNKGYRPESLRNETPLPDYLQQHENTKIQLTSLTQILNTAETVQMTLNLYLMGGSSFTSDNSLM